MNVDLPLSPSPSPPPQAGAAPNENGDTKSLGAADGQVKKEEADPFRAQNVPNEEERIRMELEMRVRKVIEELFDIASFTADVKEGQEEHLMDKIQDTIGSLGNVMGIAPQMTQSIPMEVLELIDTGRNPDLHTRSLLGRLANDNQQMLGQHMAMGDYREKLQSALSDTFPELSEYVTSTEGAAPSQQPVLQVENASSSDGPPAEVGVKVEDN